MPLVRVFHQYLCRFTDERDSPALIATHIYLLIGCGLPFLVSPASTLLALSGVIILGIGDSFAAIIGKSLGSHKIALLSSHKTYEGLLACFLSTLLACSVICPLTVSTLVGVVVVSIGESYTSQIDNLVLPLIFRQCLLISI